MELASILPIVGAAVGFIFVAFGIILLVAVKRKIVGAVMAVGLLVGGPSMYYLIQQDSKARPEEGSSSVFEEETAGSEAADLRQKRSEKENVKTAAVESVALNKSEVNEAYEQEILKEMEHISLQLSSTMEALRALNQNKNSDYWHRVNEELLSLDEALNKAQEIVYEPQGYEAFQAAYQYTLTELLDYSDQLSFAAEEYYYDQDADLLEYYMLNRELPGNVTEALDMMEDEEEVFQHENLDEEIDTLFPER